MKSFLETRRAKSDRGEAGGGAASGGVTGVVGGVLGRDMWRGGQ
jgi:hypothetical protein